GEWLLGPVERLVADAAHLVLDGVTVEDTVHLLARHGPPLLTLSPDVGGEGRVRGSVLASYSLNQYQAPNELTLTVICERGTAGAGSWSRAGHGTTSAFRRWSETPCLLPRPTPSSTRSRAGPRHPVRWRRASRRCASTSPPWQVSRAAAGK